MNRIQQFRTRFLIPLSLSIGGLVLIFIGANLLPYTQTFDLAICEPYLNDPMLTIPLETTTRDHMEAWVRDNYTEIANWDMHSWDDGRWSVHWTAPSGQYRADFPDGESPLLSINRYFGRREELRGQQVMGCLGEPTFYQAFYQQEPHDIALIMELVYPEQGLILRSYDLSGWFGKPQPSDRAPFIDMRRFQPTAPNRDAIAPYLSGLWYLEDWDKYGWADVALHEWEGWDKMQIVTDETLAQGSPRAPATATAIAAALLTAPTFPTNLSSAAEACNAILSPALYNLNFGNATLQETQTLLRGLYQHLYTDSEHRIEPSSRTYEGISEQVLMWNAHSLERSAYHYYTAFFQNNILQRVEGTSYQATISPFIACFGDPDSAILTLNDTPNGKLQSLYLFFPKQGIVTATYLYDDEITEPQESFPVMMVYQSSPQTDTFALLHAAFNFSDETTYAEWEGNLQSWQGFEQLVVTEE